MGTAPSRPESPRAALGPPIIIRGEAVDDTPKWVLLGAGEVGKSTIMRNICYCAGNEVDPTQPWLRMLQRSTWEATKDLIQQSSVENLSVRLGAGISADLEEEKKIAESFEPDTFVYTVEVGAAIHRLWQDPFIRQCYALRHEFHLPDSAGYLFDRATQWADPNYVVTPLDTLHVIRRTTGIIERTLTINDRQVLLVDTGGQRSERKKWPACFDNHPTILFVAAISDYNRLLYEDNQTNRLAESMMLLEDVVVNQSLQRSRLVLILNKMDLFHTKIQTYPLRNYFPDYNGPDQDAEAAKDWIVEQFHRRIPSHRNMSVYFTTATDPDAMRSILPTIFNEILSDFSSR